MKLKAGLQTAMAAGFIPSTLHKLPSTPRSHSQTCPRMRPRMVSQAMRIGHGFDLHRLEAGLPLILGGVTLEHDRGCAGHSDGDAVYHCVVDAVLGALSLPDIGQLFPDTDPRFKGCNSNVFMAAAYEKMNENGYELGNLDVTIILERPKMSPHKQVIRENIADLLHTDVHNVNVKAKTHEKVDAIGENRAVSVHAVAMLVAKTAEGSAASVGGSVAEKVLGMAAKRMSDIQGMTMNAGGSSTSCAVEKLYNTVIARRGADASSSWTAKLFEKGRKKIAQKVGEEAVEVVIDAIGGHKEGVVKESADLLYHLNVLWADMGVTPGDIWKELEAREGSSGIAEKGGRK